MFDITIEQKVLAKALEYLEPTVGKNATGLGDNCISMETTGNGSVKMYTTNTLEFTALESIVSAGGNTQEKAPLVDFKRFKGIIASIPENEFVSLKASVNDLLINFSLKKTPIKLVGCNNGIIPLPTNQFPMSGTITIPKTVIKQAVDSASNIVTDNASAPIYNCMRIATNGMAVEVTALDITGKRTFAQVSTATNNNPTNQVLVEVSKLRKSMKIFEDFNEMEFNMDNSMVCVTGTDIVSQYYQKTNGMITGISYYIRRITGNYPTNILNNFSPAPTEFAEINKNEIVNCISRVKAIEDSTSNGIIGFEVDGSSTIITANSAYGNIEDNIGLENSISSSFATMFKHSHLNDIIKTIGTDTFEIGRLPNHPTMYVVKTKGSSDVMFTISGMAASTATP